jgi:hypothetical protein
MQNEGKAQRRIATLTPSNTSYFSIHHSAFLIKTNRYGKERTPSALFRRRP